MKNIILIGCLIGGIFAFTGELGHVNRYDPGD